jgi:hypothetical protein
MSRQYFEDLRAEPPVVNLTAVTATTETALWDPRLYTPIAAYEAVPGKIFKVTAGGIMSFAATGTLIITPRWGTTVAGVTMGASVVALTTPGATTAHPWYLEFVAVCRTTGAFGGANGTAIGTGTFSTGIPAAGSLPATQTFGGTSAAIDTTLAAGICIGWTLSVAGTVTPQFAFIQTLN